MPKNSPGGQPVSEQRLLLAIESSCDETAAAVIRQDRTVVSNVVASQDELHLRFGGVVPEIASRAHVGRILPVIDEAVTKAGIQLADLSAIAVATRPGLVGSLLVGLTAAKTLAAVLDVPLIAVDHIEGHIYACRMAAGRDVFPAVGLVVSGGHTNLYDCKTATDFELIGCTTDDAAGEAFDKVARILGLPYPGGPSIQKAAESGDPTAFSFPRSFIKDARLDFSFSGLKTSVKTVEPMTDQRMADVAASFQESVVDVLVAKSLQAVSRYDRSTLCVGGGVAANARLREKLTVAAANADIQLMIAPTAYCTDNAAMAAIAWELFEAGVMAPLDVDVVPGLVRAK
ncbi:UNVERIFIED_CONTAM: hypothetical protein GTU68_054790 [Idotea baltica]|nr:hypothetical protein [Idotea baltica]